MYVNRSFILPLYTVIEIQLIITKNKHNNFNISITYTKKT